MFPSKILGVLFAWGGLVLGGSASVAVAQTQIPSLPPAWTLAKWDDAKDLPFKKARAALEVAPRASLQNIIKAKSGRLSGADSVELFRFALAGHLLSNKFRDSPKFSFDPCLVEMQKRPADQSYNFSRMRYILLLRRSRSYELKNLGLRLCRRDAKDYDVRYLLCSILKPEQNVADKKLAFSLLGQMKALQPQRPSLYSLGGSVHLRLWLQNKSASERSASLALYRKFLQVAPPNDPFRPQAQRLIGMLNSQ
jgi:hypothetical protein